MVDFYLPLKVLRERLSPTKLGTKSDGVPMKRSLNSDDPFNDQTSESSHDKKRQLHSTNNEIHQTKLGSPFMISKQDTKSNGADSSFLKNSNLERQAKLQKNEIKNNSNCNSINLITTASVSSSKEKSRRELFAKKEELQQKVKDGKSTTDISPISNNEESMYDYDEDNDISLEVLEDMERLETFFPTLASSYRLIDKIGEGTFSTVYKAEALDDSIKLGSDIWKSPPIKNKKSSIDESTKKRPIVALKQIYVTSSPSRIYNELKLLYLLTGNSHVAPLLDVLRYQDQVLAIMPYYQHADYRDFYRDLPIAGIKKYMWELLQALSFVHSKDIIHRDLKPTNFLYDPFKGKGVLVDFGLAEKIDTSKVYQSCPCLIPKDKRPKRVHHNNHTIRASYPKQDQRPPRRANRAGTRGFRAPEVLFKCTNQSTKLDIWSAGVIGLSFLTRKFPLFNSPDDIDALLELFLVFGLEKMQQCAELHGCGLEVQLPHISHGNPSGNLVSFISKFLRYEWANGSFPSDSVALDTLKVLNSEGTSFEFSNESTKKNYQDHVETLDLLKGCLKMNPQKRLSALEALKMPLFSEFTQKDDEVIL